MRGRSGDGESHHRGGRQPVHLLVSYHHASFSIVSYGSLRLVTDTLLPAACVSDHGLHSPLRLPADDPMVGLSPRSHKHTSASLWYAGINAPGSICAAFTVVS